MEPEPLTTQRRDLGFSFIEMMIVVTVLGILTALALPNFLGSQKTGNESTAISALRSIASAQAIHRTRYGGYGTIDELRQLNLIDETFADSSERAGYVFANVTAESDTWSIVADPDVPGQTGDRFFYINESGVIRQSDSGTADSSDPPVQ